MSNVKTTRESSIAKALVKEKISLYSAKISSINSRNQSNTKPSKVARMIKQPNVKPQSANALSKINNTINSYLSEKDNDQIESKNKLLSLAKKCRLSSLILLEKKMYYTLISYNVNYDKYNIKVINDIIFDENKHIVCLFKDYLIWDCCSDFLKRFYYRKESVYRLPKITGYYEKYTLFSPVYFSLDDLIRIMNRNVKKKKKYLEIIEENEDIVKDNKNKLKNNVSKIKYIISPSEVNDVNSLENIKNENSLSGVEVKKRVISDNLNDKNKINSNKSLSVYNYNGLLNKTNNKSIYEYNDLINYEFKDSFSTISNFKINSTNANEMNKESVNFDVTEELNNANNLNTITHTEVKYCNTNLNNLSSKDTSKINHNNANSNLNSNKLKKTIEIKKLNLKNINNFHGNSNKKNNANNLNLNLSLNKKSIHQHIKNNNTNLNSNILLSKSKVLPNNNNNQVKQHHLENKRYEKSNEKIKLEYTTTTKKIMSDFIGKNLTERLKLSSVSTNNKDFNKNDYNDKSINKNLFISNVSKIKHKTNSDIQSKCIDCGKSASKFSSNTNTNTVIGSNTNTISHNDISHQKEKKNFDFFKKINVTNVNTNNNKHKSKNISKKIRNNLVIQTTLNNLNNTENKTSNGLINDLLASQGGNNSKSNSMSTSQRKAGKNYNKIIKMSINRQCNQNNSNNTYSKKITITNPNEGIHSSIYTINLNVNLGHDEKVIHNNQNIMNNEKIIVINNNINNNNIGVSKIIRNYTKNKTKSNLQNHISDINSIKNGNNGNLNVKNAENLILNNSNQLSNVNNSNSINKNSHLIKEKEEKIKKHISKNDKSISHQICLTSISRGTEKNTINKNKKNEYKSGTMKSNSKKINNKNYNIVLKKDEYMKAKNKISYDQNEKQINIHKLSPMVLQKNNLIVDNQNLKTDFKEEYKTNLNDNIETLKESISNSNNFEQNVNLNINCSQGKNNIGSRNENINKGNLDCQISANNKGRHMVIPIEIKTFNKTKKLFGMKCILHEKSVSLEKYKNKLNIEHFIDKKYPLTSRNEKEDINFDFEEP